MAFVSTVAHPRLSALSKLGADTQSPVEAAGGSVVFTPDEMELHRFYFVELDGEPYIYRRVSTGEVEVYGLAD